MKKQTAICLLAACMLFSAAVSGQNPTITLLHKDVPLETIFKEIEKQTNNTYTFFYDSTWLIKAHRVSIEGTAIPLEKVLDICFENQPFKYAKSGTIITIISKNPRPPGILIKGRVTGADSMPLRANIQIQGSTRGVTADENGYFEIESIGKNTMLWVSHIGYVTNPVKAGTDEPILQIRLQIEEKYLDEVIRKGFTNSSRRYNLGTITKITAEDIEKQPVNNLFAALQGRVPNMLINQRGGLPGATFTVQIRGQRSIGASPGQFSANSPLIIIDGVPFLSPSETLIQRSEHFATAYSPFSTIDPADIESIEILKDANATSIYGSYGANGVILITTKKPTATGRTSINVNMYAGWARITRAMDYMNTQQYLKMRREAFENDQESMTNANAYDLLVWDTIRNIDWKKELIEGTAHMSNAHIRLSGGSEKTQFTASVGHNRESTVFPVDHGKWLSSLSFQLFHTTKKLEFAVASSYGFDKSHLPNRDPANYLDLPPTSPYPLDSSGHLVFREQGIPIANPYIFLYQPTKLTMERLTVSTRLNYKILPWIHMKANMGSTVITGNEKSLFRISTQDPEVLPREGRAIFGSTKSRNWIVEPQIEFLPNKQSRHKIKGLIGTSFREQIATSNLINAIGYDDDAMIESWFNARDHVFSNEKKQYRVYSAYGLINYNLDNKYIFEATARRDGSSRFGPDKQFACFASGAAGWIFSNEDFVRTILPFISYGKIRASYGTTGNDQIGDYQFLDIWVSTQGPGFRPGRLYNNDYSWELHKSFDIGLDIGLFNDRIFLSGTWNRSRTGNQLIGVTLPTQTGFDNVLMNFPGLVQNKNTEIELNAKIIKGKNFKWNTSLNISIQRNKLLKFPGLDSSNYKYNYRIGFPLNLVLGYRTDGIDPVTGVYRILDKKGDLIDIPNNFPSEDDRVPIGTYNPDYFGGLQNSLEYRNWQLDFLFQFVKQKGLDPIIAKSQYAGALALNQTVDLLQRWQQQQLNPSASYQQYTQSTITAASVAGYFYASSDASITDASYIRLKNLSLSYTLPAAWSKKLKITNASLYVQGQNLLTITSYKGHDPESGSINPYGLPPLKILAVGIRASL